MKKARLAVFVMLPTLLLIVGYSLWVHLNLHPLVSLVGMVLFVVGLVTRGIWIFAEDEVYRIEGYVRKRGEGTQNSPRGARLFGRHPLSFIVALSLTIKYLADLREGKHMAKKRLPELSEAELWERRDLHWKRAKGQEIFALVAFLGALACGANGAVPMADDNQINWPMIIVAGLFLIVCVVVYVLARYNMSWVMRIQGHADQREGPTT